MGPALLVGFAIGKVSIEEVSRELWPFYAAMILALLLVTYMPTFSLWLPGILRFRLGAWRAPAGGGRPKALNFSCWSRE